MFQGRAFIVLLSFVVAPAVAAQDLPWRPVQIAAPEPATHELFGFDVAVSGDTLAATALETHGQSLAVYVFVRNQGQWALQATLRLPHKPHDLLPSLALSGDTLAVGFPGADARAVDSGAVYVFARRGGFWSIQALLTASDARGGDQFGFSVALPGGSGSTLAVGSLRGGGPPSSPGAAYVFQRSHGAWTEEARIVPTDVSANAWFGWDLDLAPAGDLLAVAAIVDTTGASTPQAPGSLHVYRRHGTAWVREALFRGPQSAQLGETVSLSDRALVAGSAIQKSFVYSRQGGTWHREAVLTRGEDPQAAGFFGWFAATSGPLAVALGNRNGEGEAAYLFERGGDGAWIRLGLLDGSVPFGGALSLDDGTLAVPIASPSLTGGVEVLTSPQADVDTAVRLLAPPSPLEAGPYFLYRARVFNRGGRSASNVELRVDLPHGVSRSAIHTERGTCGGSDPVVCRLGTLGAGETALVTVLAYSSSAGAKTATATVAASRFDSNPADNSSSVTTVFIFTAGSEHRWR